jgi:hypothetical protein
VRVEEARKEAEELAVSNVQRLNESREGLLACMQSTKAVLGSVLAKAGSSESDELPEANVHTFSEWLTAEVGQLLPVLDNVLDFGAFVTTLGVARSRFRRRAVTTLKS